MFRPHWPDTRLESYAIRRLAISRRDLRFTGWGQRSMPKGTVGATTAQSLGALIKSAREIMRKDKGLNGDLDRLPMLTWIMFLKFLDDLEIQREQEARLSGARFRAAI